LGMVGLIVAERGAAGVRRAFAGAAAKCAVGSEIACDSDAGRVGGER